MAKANKKLSNSVKQIIDDTSFREARTNSDTVRVWENYREQALLWRGLALLQIIVTFSAIILAFYFYTNRNVKINVPEKPLPGYYDAKDIPESEFVSTAEEFVNLIASYQFKIARRQFDRASEFLVQPMLGKFEFEMMVTELNLIEQTRRTQLFFVIPERTTMKRVSDKMVEVSLIGERMKTIAGKEYATEMVQYTITLTTIPRHKFNKYGIVVKNLTLTKLQ